MKQEELTQKIIGVFYSVYNELGHRFLESVYEEAMILCLQEAGLKVDRQLAVPVWFHGKKIGDFRADIVVNSTRVTGTQGDCEAGCLTRSAVVELLASD